MIARVELKVQLAFTAELLRPIFKNLGF